MEGAPKGYASYNESSLRVHEGSRRVHEGSWEWYMEVEKQCFFRFFKKIIILSAFTSDKTLVENH